MDINIVKDLGGFYLVTYNNGVKSNIPKNPTNRDYRKVQEWLKDNKLTVDTLEEKKDKLLELNNKKRIEARDKGVDITVDGITYLANKETVEGYSMLFGLNGDEPIYWKDKDGKPHILDEQKQKNLAHTMKNIALAIEKIYMKTEITIASLTEENIDQFDLDKAWKKGLGYVIK